MFGFLTRTRRPSARPVRPSRQLVLEPLEDRFCPAAPSFTNLSVTILHGNDVQVSGTISDERPQNALVSLQGVVSGEVVPNAGGQFSLEMTASELGEVIAEVNDDEGYSNSTEAALTAPQPLVSVTLTHGPRKTITLAGHVTAPTNAGLFVSFTGALDASVTTNTSGDFTLTTNQAVLGTISVSAQDIWGQISEYEYEVVTSAVPALTFWAGEFPNKIWTFGGTVTDEDPAGLTVYFSGVPTLDGKSATVKADGTYKLTVTLTNGDQGIAWADVADWWGLAAAEVGTQIRFTT